MRDVTFGQYYPVDSPIHKLNPCIKLLIYIAVVVFIFLIKNFYGFIAIGVLLITTIILSKIPFSAILKSLRAIVFLIIVTVILNLFFSNGGGWEVKIWFIKITQRALVFSGFMALRLISLALFSGLLTLTSTPIELTDGIEVLLKPLALIKFPVHTLALIMSIALRFIPTLTEKTEKIIMAQKSRGSEFDSGNLIKKLKALVPVLIPLLVSSFNIADQLGEAMDSRCYNGSKGRTKYKKLCLRWKDLFASIFVIAIFTSIILLNIFLGASI